ncbi:MAG: hypothetical protein Q9159_007062 [Coniocarpon cinnabarinum]
MAPEITFTSPLAPPAIPAKYQSAADGAVFQDDSSVYEDDSSIQEDNFTNADMEGLNRRKSMRMTLDMPSLGFGPGSEDLEFGMDKEFDRLLEEQKVDPPPQLPPITFASDSQDEKDSPTTAQPSRYQPVPQADLPTYRKRGYLMRQNTKVVVATNRNFSNEKPPLSTLSESQLNSTPAMPAPLMTKDRETRSAGNSPRKASGPTVTTEPWNGKKRRHSTRQSIITSDKPLARQSLGPQASGLDSLAEDQQSLLEQEPGAERGRFFVKVMGVKSLDLPLPRNERTHFQLTLDNGLHCVTTATLELGRNVQIGQEFELTVFDELDFSLTLQTKLERPSSSKSASSQSSILDSPKKKEKSSAFSRLLSSPKKREAERKQLEEQAEFTRQREREAQRAKTQPTAWDLLHNLVGPDGSFAQTVVSVDDYEEKAFGRPITVDVPCYNNWAVEDSYNSTKSKHGGVQRKPPYQIGNLSLQLLYIPKPKGVTDGDMPQSMSACVKQLKEAELNTTRSFEGPMSQQGGDCPYWRRRFFKLNGSVLTAYHETTRQRRANIRLAKATKLIDDRTALTQKETSAKGGKGRRQSAFATDTEGYMFVEEGFRICFANGDTIDFYADSRQQKEEWMDHLSNVVGKDFSAEKPTWTSVVLAHEKMKGATSGCQQPTPTTVDNTSKPLPEPNNPLRSNPAVSSKPAVPPKTTSPAKSSLPTKQAQVNRPASPSKAAQPTRPASPSKSSQPARSGSPTKQSSPTKPARSSMPLEKVMPACEDAPRQSLQGSPQKGLASSKTSDNSGLRRKAVRSMIF